jgi:murein DD-endopeptidase MepM/ murein hydrolase activator NlpD
MKRRTQLALAALLLFAASPAPSGSGRLEIRFHPERALHRFEAETRRHVSTIVLQNAAIVNAGTDSIELAEGAFELWAGEALVQESPITVGALDAFAERTGSLAASGMIAALPSQFAPDRMLAGARPVGSRTLASGEALLIGGRAFLVQGAPVDRFRLRIAGTTLAGKPVEALADLPVRGSGSPNEYVFPLSGVWWVPAAPTLHSHHRWAVPQEFALDIVKLASGESTHRGDGSQLADYAAWGAEVRAVADGTVVAAVDRFPDSEDFLRRPAESDESYFMRTVAQQRALLAQGEEAIAGNYVVVAHAGGEHSHYVHLQAGSVRVRPGDAVRRGQALGLLGSSGNSSEPHLHFHLSDGPSPLGSAGVPIRFTGVRILGADWDRQIQSGDLVIAE